MRRSAGVSSVVSRPGSNVQLPELNVMIMHLKLQPGNVLLGTGYFFAQRGDNLIIPQRLR
jgi:hypothetical protein